MLNKNFNTPITHDLMESFGFNNVTAEKVRAMRRYNRLPGIAKAFRLLELLSFLLFLKWTFERLPFAVKISGDFVSKLGGVIASPIFVFLVSNVIIVALIANSGLFFTARNADSKIYKEIIKNAESTHSKSESREEIVYQDKEIISEVNVSVLECNEMEQEQEEEEPEPKPRVYGRSKSKKLEREKVKNVLRRSESETENCREIENIDEKLIPEDELSNEEFQRAIEDFITKQLRFRREESLSIVCPPSSSLIK